MSHQKTLMNRLVVGASLVMLISRFVLADKPPKDPPPPEPAPVDYRIVWLESLSRINDINDSLLVVGQTEVDGVGHAAIVDLSISTTPMILEELVDSFPPEWSRLSSALLINNAGLVVGGYRVADDSIGGIYICDTTDPTYPISQLMAWDETFSGTPTDINEAGDVVFDAPGVALRQEDGTYEYISIPDSWTWAYSDLGINDATEFHSVQVAANLNLGEISVYELTQTDGVYTFVPVCTFEAYDSPRPAINDAGLVAHALRVRGKAAAACYDMVVGASRVITDIATSRSVSVDLNSVGQICGSWDEKNGGRLGFFYDSIEDQSWPLDDLVFSDNPDDEVFWFSQVDRSANVISDPVLGTEFPAIGGACVSDYIRVPYVLLPVPANSH